MIAAFRICLKNKFKIGGDASAAAGPVGRSGQASTDWKMNAELLSYSRNKGLFAGISLDGTSVSQNSEDTEIYFGGPHSFEAILKGEIAVPEGAEPFVAPWRIISSKPKAVNSPPSGLLEANGAVHRAAPFFFVPRTRSGEINLYFASINAGKT